MPSPQHQNEITLKDLILKIQQWFRYLKGKWLVILAACIVGAGIGFGMAMLQTIRYKAEITFVLEESKGNTLGAYAGIASQFGIDLGATSGSGLFSGDNILEFLKSRLMVEKALLSPLVENNKVFSLADRYIEISGLSKEWADKPALKNLSFPITQKRATFSRDQDSVIQILYNKIIKKDLDVSKPDKKLTFISVSCTTGDEAFSKIFTERLVKEATDFYILTKTQRSKVAVDKLQAKSDSITDLLNRKTYSVAASQDMNLNPARNVAGVNIELATRDKVVLQTMYAEVVKNLELSRMAMAQETPIIQIVDTPIFPLKKEKLGKIKAVIIGGFIGGLLIVLTLLMIRIYKEIMGR